MKKLNSKILVLTATFFFLTGATVTGHAGEIQPTAITGTKYAIYLFNAEVGSMEVSFEENFSFMVDTYDGFGLYLPIGSLFTAFYWAPNYDREKDLLLIFNGLVVGDFIGGWGIALPNFNPSTIFLFLGTQVEQVF
jgi:hypothetical protein